MNPLAEFLPTTQDKNIFFAETPQASRHGPRPCVGARRRACLPVGRDKRVESLDEVKRVEEKVKYFYRPFPEVK